MPPPPHPPQHPSEDPEKFFTPDKLPQKTLSRLTGASPNPTCQNTFTTGVMTPAGVGALFFSLQQQQQQHLRLDIPTGEGRVCSAAVLDQMQEPVCPRARGFGNKKTKKKTCRLVPAEPRPPAHSSNLILMRFHHRQWSPQRRQRSFIWKKSIVFSPMAFTDFSKVQAQVRAGRDRARLCCGHTVKQSLSEIN